MGPYKQTPAAEGPHLPAKIEEKDNGRGEEALEEGLGVWVGTNGLYQRKLIVSTHPSKQIAKRTVDGGKCERENAGWRNWRISYKDGSVKCCNESDPVEGEANVAPNDTKSGPIRQLVQ